jgi:hypothetical protein
MGTEKKLQEIKLPSPKKGEEKHVALQKRSKFR